MESAKIHLVSWLRSLVLLSCAATLITSAWALDPTRTLAQYNCRTWTRQNGLPISSINSVTQTADGYIWLGTSGGIVRFDGLEFRMIPLDNVAALRSTTVRVLAPAATGGLWVGLENGSFGFCDGESFSFRGSAERGGLQLNVDGLYETKNRDLWIGAEQQVAILTSSGEYREVLSVPAPDLIYGAAMLEDSRGRMLIGTLGHGLYLSVGGHLSHVENTDFGAIGGIAEGPDGKIWLATARGLQCFDKELHPRPITRLETDCSSVVVDRNGVVWVSTRTMGIARYYKDQYTFLDKAGGLPSLNVNALFQDREGSIWVGTIAGLCQLTDVKFATVPLMETSGDEYVAGVASSARGGVWLAGNGGVTYYDGTYTTYRTGVELPAVTPKRVFEASNGDVYVVGSGSSVTVISNGKVVARHTVTGMPVALSEDAHGVLVSVGGEVYRVSRNSIEPYRYTGDKPDFRWILSLMRRPDDSVWVASEMGIYRLKDGVAEIQVKASELEDPRVQFLYEDEDGVVWASLLTGLLRIKDGHFCRISRRDGLLDDDIYGIASDNQGNLWVDSARGVFRVARKDLADFAEHKITRVPCEIFDEVDMRNFSDKTRSQEHLACRTADGRIWFPAAKGVVVVDPANIAINRIPPPVQVERLLVNRKPVKDQAVVAPGLGELEVHFSALTYVAPRKTKFRYRLSGYDKDWVEAGDRRLAFYTNLSPGEYRFDVTACNADGIWNEQGASVGFRLLPHFYQTVWFYLSCAGLSVASLAGFYVQRVKHLKRKQQALREARDALEREVQHRTAELAQVNSSLTQEVEDHRQTEAQLKQRTLSLEKEIQERKQMQLEVERVHRQLMEASRQAGMAEIATNVLHNVGNVLNSVNVSSVVALEAARKSAISSLPKLVAMLKEHEKDLGTFVTQDPRGKQLVTYLSQLTERLQAEQRTAIEEHESLCRNIGHIKEIVAMQQNYATVSGLKEIVDVRELVEDSLKMNADSLSRHGVELVRDFQDVPPITADKHKILQILVNLVRNAKYACGESNQSDKRVVVRLSHDDQRIRITVTDNGVGIPQENLRRIFNHGFTTRKEGHGFGLHSGSNAAREMGGALTAESEGLGKGATFIFELPIKPTGTSPSTTK